MPEATLTSKGQVTLPKEIRDALGLKAGDRLLFVLRPDGSLAVHPKTRSVRSLYGILGRPPKGRHLKVEDMDDAIADAVAEELGRSIGK